MVAGGARYARCHPQPAVVDNVCTRCWSYFPGTLRTCPGCGARLTAANAAEAPPPSAERPRPPIPTRAAVAAPPRRHRLIWVLAVAIVLSFALGIFPLPQLGLWGNPGCSFPGAACTRVLFIGNSYTSVNDLPDTFAGLAWAGGHRVQTQALDEGGWTLQQHVAAPETAATLASEHWDVVVLQEQSEIPSLAVDRTQMMYPAATRLVAEIRVRDARPILYLTFAHQAGWPDEGLADYPTMQTAIDAGYLGIAGQLGVPVAPVGVAWEAVVGQASHPPLWQSDGSHPTVSGTYLAACVFYATLFRESPEGLAAPDGVPGNVALILQRAAAVTVLGNPAEWNLAS